MSRIKIKNITEADNETSQEGIMRDINIQNYKEIYRHYLSDHNLSNFLDNRRKNNSNDQIGGGTIRIIGYEYNDKEFVLYEKESEDGYDISIHRNNDDTEYKCLHIIINVELKLAYIKNISYHKNCLKGGLDSPGGGSNLLKVCINYLKDTKDTYGVKRIQLMDTSSFLCKSNNKHIQLPIMHTLIFGDTWYGKYGFKPYDSHLDKEDEELSKYYQENKDIVRSTEVDNTNLFNYLFEVLKNQEGKTEKEVKRFIDEYHEKYHNYTISEFFKMFLMKFDKNCGIFSQFYRGFYKNQKLYNFYGHSFYLDI
jgi:hypothetical protein